MSPAITGSGSDSRLHDVLSALLTREAATDEQLDTPATEAATDEQLDTPATDDTTASDTVITPNDSIDDGVEKPTNTKANASNENENEATKEKETNGTIMSDFDKICHYLKEQGWNFMPKSAENVIVTMASGTNGTFQIVVDLKQDSCILIVYIYLPCKVAPNKRMDIAEFITRANHGVIVGNFEEDFRDGEVRFKGSTCYNGSVLSTGMIEDVIQRSAFTMNRYFPGIMQVIYGNVEPQRAIAEIEPNQSRGDAGTALAELLVQALESGGDASEGSDESTGDTPVAVATPSSL